MKLNEAMKLLEAEGIDYMSVARFTRHYAVVIAFEEDNRDNRIGYGETPCQAFDSAISKIHE